MRDFVSVWRRQIILVIKAPHRETLMKIGATSLFIGGHSVDIRIRPYLPSLRRMAARIIDPATGASTWAFGSHRCVKYMGIFTINAMIVMVHHTLVIRVSISVLLLKIIDAECFLFMIIIRLTRRGRDAVMVYIMRYMPA